MTEGRVRIILSHKEVDKENLWLKPKEGRDGYDLLYYGANGWAPLIDCQQTLSPSPPVPEPPIYPRVELDDCKSPTSYTLTKSN